MDIARMGLITQVMELFYITEIRKFSYHNDLLLLPHDAMHSAAYSVVRCTSVSVSVCLSIRLTGSCTVSTRVNIGLFSNFFTVGSLTIQVFSIPKVTAIFRH